MKKMICMLLSALFLITGTVFVMRSGTSQPARDAELKRQAAEKLEDCISAVGQIRREMGIAFSEDDRYDCGLIGPEYTFITTTLGNLEAKRSSINPNWAAVVVDMFTELGLKKGDRIAVNCSGSFPALNLAVLCAAEVYGLDPMIISSFGASTHGANDPEFTYQDMEHALYEHGLLQLKSTYFSIGGRKDIGGEMDPDLAASIVERLQGYGYRFFYEQDLLRNIELRYETYREHGPVRCFVNVGGNDVSFGDSKVIVYADGGILTDLPDRDQSTGLVQMFLRDGIPVIHLLNIKSIASQYGLPIDPEQIPTAGKGEIYEETAYSRILAGVFLAAGLIPLIAGKVREKKWQTESDKNTKKDANG